RKALTFTLRRRTPLRARGWYCGDSHNHMVHGERKVPINFAYAALSARAEALDYLALAQQWTLPHPTPQSLSAACRAVSVPDFLLTWNLEAPKNYWRGDVSHCMGHGWTVGMAGSAPGVPDAIATLMAMSAHDYESDKTPTPNFASHALIHALGGIVSYSHPCRWWTGTWGGRGSFPVEQHKFISNLAQELPFDTVAGPTYDTLDVMMQPAERTANADALRLWSLLLNHGYRIPSTGSSDATFDNPGRARPGAVRVYSRIDGAFSLAKISAAIKAGHSFSTSGPLVTFEINGHDMGSVVPLRGPAKFEARIEAWASGAYGKRLTSIEVFRDGEIYKTIPVPDRKDHFTTQFQIDEHTDAWYFVRCYGSNDLQVAITNPIYFETPTYHAPRPAQARVVAIVRDKVTRKRLSGTFEVVGTPGMHRFRRGKFKISLRATATLRVSVQGHAPLVKNIFTADPRLLNLTLNMRVGQMLDWSTYEAIRSLLGRVRLEFDLSP
ncbi:MAG: CehA/McbA family metallohydrolase, partial [Bryobacteraceae bacterium]